MSASRRPRRDRTAPAEPSSPRGRRHRSTPTTGAPAARSRRGSAPSTSSIEASSGRGNAGASDGSGARRGRARAPRRRIRLDNDARRAQLLELGVRTFSERTYDEVSIDDIARAAGISKGLLYHYFPTKRDLYLAGLRLTADQLIAETERAAALGLPPLERIRSGLDAYLSHVERTARPFVALMRGGIGSDPEVVGVIESVRATYMERFVATAAGTPMAPALDAPLVRIALRGWIGFVEAASLEWVTNNHQIDRAGLRELLINALFATLRVAIGPGFTSDALAPPTQ